MNAADAWYDQLLQRLTGQSCISILTLAKIEDSFQVFTDFADEQQLTVEDRQLLADQAMVQLLQIL